MDIETGARARFRDKGLPDRMIDPPTTPPGDLVSWQDYFGGLKGVVVAVDATNDVAVVRGRDRAGNPYTVEIAPEHLVVEEGV